MKRMIASSILSASALFGLCSDADAGSRETITGSQTRAFGATGLVFGSTGSARPSASLRSCNTQRRSDLGIYHRRTTKVRSSCDCVHGLIRDSRRDCYQRIWVPPRYREVLVGYKCCGAPIYRRVMVHQGYWKTVRHRH